MRASAGGREGGKAAAHVLSPICQNTDPTSSPMVVELKNRTPLYGGDLQYVRKLRISSVQNCTQLPCTHHAVASFWQLLCVHADPPNLPPIRLTR